MVVHPPLLKEGINGRLAVEVNGYVPGETLNYVYHITLNSGLGIYVFPASFDLGH